MKSYFDDPKDTKYIIMGTLCRKKVCKKGVFMVKKVIKVLAITITIREFRSSSTSQHSKTAANSSVAKSLITLTPSRPRATSSSQTDSMNQYSEM